MRLKFQCPASMVPHLEMIEKGEYDVSYNHPRPVILDVEANVGGFAIWACRRWPTCEIHCYEPVPDNFAMLKANVDILKNAGFGNPIYINNFAIGEAVDRRVD